MIKLIYSRDFDFTIFTTGLTVLITTHYIEEAKEANQVAFIYRGLCLEQNSPQNLLKKYNCSTLEEVSYRAVFGRRQSVMSKEPSNKPFLDFDINNLKMSKTHLKALFWKLATQMKTNLLIIALVVIISVSTITLPSIAFGPPKNIPIAVIDADTTNLSRSFVDTLDPDIFRVNFSERVDTGIESVVKAKNKMFAEIPERFY